MQTARKRSWIAATLALAAALFGEPPRARAAGYLIKPGPGTDIAVRADTPPYYKGRVDVFGYFDASDSRAVITGDANGSFGVSELQAGTMPTECKGIACPIVDGQPRCSVPVLCHYRNGTPFCPLYFHHDASRSYEFDVSPPNAGFDLWATSETTGQRFSVINYACAQGYGLVCEDTFAHCVVGDQVAIQTHKDFPHVSISVNKLDCGGWGTFYDPVTLTPGQPAFMNWYADTANGCVMSVVPAAVGAAYGLNGAVPFNGQRSLTMPPLVATQTFTITCTNETGSTTRTLTVNVH